MTTVNNTAMKKSYFKIAIILIVLFAAALVLLSGCDSQITSSKQLANNCIRIHIRANSNSEEDQAVKLAVRDCITDYLENKLANCSTKDEAQSVLCEQSSSLIEIANKALSDNGFCYQASLRMGNEYFPERTYDGYTFPSGNYDALIINLGSGSGENWWCVAFPPLCFVPDSASGEKIVYKSWVKEMLDKLFNKQ